MSTLDMQIRRGGSYLGRCNFEGEYSIGVLELNIHDRIGGTGTDPSIRARELQVLSQGDLRNQ